MTEPAQALEPTPPPAPPPGVRPALPPARASLAAALRVSLRRPFASIGACAVLSITIVAGCLVPLANFAFLLFALAPLVGGLPILGLALVDGQPVRISTLLGGFRQYERFLSLFWVGYLVALASCGPLLVAAWIDRRITWGESPWVLWTGGAVSLILLAWSLRRYPLVLFLAADTERTATVAELLDQAAELVAERQVGVWRRVLLFLALAALGFVAGSVAVLSTLPLALLATAHLYRTLRPLRSPDRSAGELRR